MAHQLSQGIISAAILPFESNGAIDWKTFDRYIAEVAAGEPKAIAMNMDASEGYSLSFDEQLAVVRRLKSVLAGSDVQVVSGLLAAYTIGAAEFAKKLVDAGAQALAVFPPFPIFIGKPSKEMVLDYHHAVHDAVDVPLITFQMPLTMVDYPPGTVTEFAKMKKVVAMKEATFDVSRTRLSILEAASAPRKIGILTGSDTFILEAMLMGCDGALIGFAASFTAELVRMHKLAASGEIATAWEIWGKLGPLARFSWGVPIREYRVRMKYALELQGVLPHSTVRSPAMPIPAEDRRTMEDLFKAHGLNEARFLPSGRKTAKSKAA
jgi:4-hydroxy-tetrahydrodipicolinate synthase